jgi:hypothetical protein
MVADATARWPFAFDHGSVSSSSDPSVDDAIAAVLQAADDGTLRDRRGQPLGGRALRRLERHLLGDVSTEFGKAPLAELGPGELEAAVAGLSPRRRRAALEAVRTLYDHAIETGSAERNPADGLPPAGRHDGRSRIDVAISIALQALTLAFALVAVYYVAQTL